MRTGIILTFLLATACGGTDDDEYVGWRTTDVVQKNMPADPSDPMQPDPMDNCLDEAELSERVWQHQLRLGDESIFTYRFFRADGEYFVSTDDTRDRGVAGTYGTWTLACDHVELLLCGTTTERFSVRMDGADLRIEDTLIHEVSAWKDPDDVVSEATRSGCR